MTDYCLVELPRQALAGGRAIPARSPAVFVAYRFDDPDSQAFRTDLETAIRKTVSLNAVEVLDGHVYAGQAWPSEVRKRLRRAAITVGDLTTLNREVLFECGFAWGLGRPILPVAKTRESRTRVPSWFTDIQFGAFSTEDEMSHIVDSIAHHVGPGAHRPNKAPKPANSNPRSVVFIGGENGDSSTLEMTVAACSEHGMDHPIVIRDTSSLQSIEAGPAEAMSRASLLVGVLTGIPADFLVHFSSGAVLANPTSGESKQHLSKRVILVVPQSSDAEALTPSSARKIREVAVVTPQQLQRELYDFGTRYKKWQAKLRG